MLVHYSIITVIITKFPFPYLLASESLFHLFGKIKNARSGCLDRLLWQLNAAQCRPTEHGKTSPTIARLMQSSTVFNGRWCHIRWCDRNAIDHGRYDVSIVIYLCYYY